MLVHVRNVNAAVSAQVLSLGGKGSAKKAQEPPPSCSALRWQDLDFKGGFTDLSEVGIPVFHIPRANSCPFWTTYLCLDYI